VISPLVPAKAGIQSLLLQMLGPRFRGGSTANYVADTKLRWNDVGARFGLDVKIAVAGPLTVGFSGSLGVASRSTSSYGIGHRR
jgi:hypothetical protein